MVLAICYKSEIKISNRKQNLNWRRKILVLSKRSLACKCREIKKTNCYFWINMTMWLNFWKSLTYLIVNLHFCVLHIILNFHLNSFLNLMNFFSRISKIQYANVIGSAMYMMVCTKPDFAHSISILSEFMSNLEKNIRIL